MITQSQNIAKQTVLTPILTSILYLLSPIGTQRQIFEKPRNELIVLPDFEFQLLISFHCYPPENRAGHTVP